MTRGKAKPDGAAAGFCGVEAIGFPTWPCRGRGRSSAAGNPRRRSTRCRFIPDTDLFQSHTRTRAALIPPIPPSRIVRDESLRCGMMSLPVSPTEATQKEMQIMRKKFLRGTLAPLLLITGTAVPLLTGAAAVSAQEVTQAEKERALQYLESTKKNLTEATKRLSEAQR